VQTSNYWYTEVEEGQERSDKYRDTEQLGRLLVWGLPSRSGRRKRFGQGMACLLKVRGGTPVFIVVRCIAATRAAGTVYEQINQSINQPSMSNP
jgi:hypothetical protein